MPAASGIEGATVKQVSLDQETFGIAQIAQEAALSRQTVYRIKDDPTGSEAATLEACSGAAFSVTLK
jgi:DNA-binding phage protein